MTGADQSNDVAAAPAAEEPQANQGRLRQLVSGASWQAASLVVPLIINFMITPYAIDGLTKARWGIILLVTTITTVLSQLDGGIGQAAMRNFSLYVGEGDKKAVTRMLMSLLGLITLFSAAAFVLMWVLSDLVLSQFRIPKDLLPEAIVLLRVLTAIVAVAMVRQLFASLLFAHHIFRLNTLAYLIGHVIYTIGLLCSIWFHWGLYGVAATFVLQQIVSTVIIVPQAVRRMDFHDLKLMERTEFWEFFKYSWQVQISGLANYLMQAKDMMWLNNRMSTAVAQPYAQGVSFGQQLRMMPFSAVAPIQSMLGRAVGAKGVEGAVEDFESIQRYWVIGVTGFCMAAIPAAYYGVPVWLPGELSENLPGGWVVAILMVGHMCFLWGEARLIWCLTLGHAEVDRHSAVFALVLNVLLTLAFLPFLGVMGIIYASATSMYLGMWFFLWISEKALPFTVRSFLLDVPWVPGIVTFAVSLGTQMLAHGHTPRHGLGLLTCAALAVPAVIVYVLMTIGPKAALGLAKQRLKK